VAERDVAAVLSALVVARRPGSYAYVGDDGRVDPSRCLAVIVESEGRTAVVDLDHAVELGLEPAFAAAWITIEAETALDAVGLTAAVATALADAGIACNVLAGLHHDHLLVPDAEADRAVQVLEALRGSHRPGRAVAPDRRARSGRAVRLRDKTEAGFDAWLPVHTADYIAQRVGAGEDEQVARRTSETQHAVTFPGGRPAAGHHVMDVLDDGEVVGTLWMGPPFNGDGDTWFVFKVEIDEGFRGRGLGRAAMEAAEDWTRTRGGSRIALNVFGPNAAARSLYGSLGYEVASIGMHKDL
jgi:GNAT superfamily N-acetyltransferase